MSKFLVTSAIADSLSILPKSRWQLVWVKPWLQSRSTKSVYHNIISELKLLDCSDYRKCFLMDSEIDFYFFAFSLGCHSTLKEIKFLLFAILQLSYLAKRKGNCVSLTKILFLNKI